MKHRLANLHEDFNGYHQYIEVSMADLQIVVFFFSRTNRYDIADQ